MSNFVIILTEFTNIIFQVPHVSELYVINLSFVVSSFFFEIKLALINLFLIPLYNFLNKVAGVSIILNAFYLAHPMSHTNQLQLQKNYVRYNLGNFQQFMWYSSSGYYSHYSSNFQISTLYCALNLYLGCNPFG